MDWGNDNSGYGKSNYDSSSYGSNRFGNDSTSTGYGNHANAYKDNMQHSSSSQQGHRGSDYGGGTFYQYGKYIAEIVGLTMMVALFYALFICQI